MDFNSLGVGAPFYVLNKSEKPSLCVGVVKEKTAPQPRYQPQAAPSAFNGTQMQQVVTVTATINGKDVVYQDIPVNVEIAQRGNEIFSATREAMLQHVDCMMQASKKALDMVGYHKSVLAEGEKMLEVLNPRYAEEKRQATVINSLKERQQELEKQNKEILSILRKLSGEPTPEEQSE